ncbi:MAG: translation initiation factor [Muribaculaceae bacterium]|nr:translation initiation factor [Muribaculaceae bacterium]MDE6320663.1 translation initiation factor [Muribaculaceae bacterium]
MDWKEALQNLNLPDAEGDTPAVEPAPKAEPANEGALLVELDRKGRRGKEATIVSGFTIDDDRIAALASQLKTKLGTGGSARGGEILIQGNRIDAVASLLTSQGFKVKVKK